MYWEETEARGYYCNRSGSMFTARGCLGEDAFKETVICPNIGNLFGFLYSEQGHFHSIQPT